MDKNRSRLYLIVGISLCVVGFIGSISGFAAFSERDHHRPAVGYEAPAMPDEDTGSGSGSVELTTTFDPSNIPAADDPAADDGELHDARTKNDHYTLEEGFWAQSDTAHHDAYGLDVQTTFAIKYPKVKGDLENADKINEAIRAVAMDTVDYYYNNPSKDAVRQVKRMVEGDNGNFGVSEGADALLTSTVEYAVTYNDDNLLSVCFSDDYCVGNYYGEFLELRTINVNLQTGEVYELDDVLTVNESIASSFVDNLVQMSGEDENKDGKITDDECFAITLVGRDALVEGLQGKGELAGPRLYRCLFIDANGKPNLGVTYWLSKEDVGFSRGWWDVTITDEQVKEAKKDSELWGLLGL